MGKLDKEQGIEKGWGGAESDKYGSKRTVTQDPNDLGFRKVIIPKG